MTLGSNGGETTERDEAPETRALSRPALVRVGIIALLLGLTIGWFNLFPRYERSGDELLRNGRFDHGLEGWTVQGPADAISVADGTVTLALDDSRRSARMSQVLTAGPEQRTLGLSVEVATEGVKAGPKAWQLARVYLVGRTSEGNPHWKGHISPVRVSGDNPWHRYSGTLVLPEGVREAVVKLALARATGVMRIRDVSVFPVREVAAFRYGTLALLGGWVIAGALVALPLVRSVRSRTARILIALIVLAILIGTLIPRSLQDQIFRPAKEAFKAALALLPALPSEIDRMLAISIGHLDAYGHAFLFFAIAMVFRVFRPDGRSIAQYGHLLLFAAVSETLQYFAPTRQPGFHDWLSDVAGITLAFLLYAIVIGRFRKRQLRASSPQG